MITLETPGEAFGPNFSGRRKNSSPESESGGPVPVESDQTSVNIIAFLIIKPTRCTNFSNLFWNEILHVSDNSYVHHQEFFTVHTAMVYVIQVCRQLSSRIRMVWTSYCTCEMSTDFHDQAVSKCVWLMTGFRFEVLMANNNETLKMKATVCPEIFIPICHSALHHTTVILALC